MGRTRGKTGSVPSTVSGLLHEVLRGKPAEKRIREGRIWDVWPAAVGKQIASKARPMKVSDGVLTVAVATAPWMQQLSFLKREICEKINSLSGEELVRDIFLVSGRMEPPPKKRIRPSEDRPLSSAEKQLIARETAIIDDPEIRSALSRLMTRHLAAMPGHSPEDKG